jgi:flagellin
MDAMSTEIDRIAGTTTWAGANLMENSNTNFSFQVGAATGDKNQISVDIKSMNTNGLSLSGGTGGLDEVTDATVTTTDADKEATDFLITAGSSTQSGTITFDIAGVDYSVEFAAGASVATIGAAAVAAINDGTGAAASNDGSTLHGYVATFDTATLTLSDVGGTTVITSTVTNNEHSHATVAAGVSSISVEAGGGNTAADNARTSIGFIDAAIKQVNVQRSELGAVSNRLNHTVNNLTNISSNLSAAKGGIEDADFALETTNLAKNQILQQASTAMLAQANASKQNVLSLLQG